MAISDQLERLREQADACRRGAIALDAKLRMLEEGQAFGSMRERLLASSARIDRAVETLCDRQGLRPRLPRSRR